MRCIAPCPTLVRGAPRAPVPPPGRPPGSEPPCLAGSCGGEASLRGRLRGVAALVALAAAGCAGYGPQGLSPGAPEQAVVQRMGPPTGVHPRPEGGKRLEFARGPMGRHTFMVDLDPGGRVLQWEQVLTEARFNALQAGLSRQEVLYRLGRPSHEMHIPRRHERVWSYRYESPFCQWFQVSLDTRTDRVTQTGYNVDPLCDANDREDR